MLKIGSVRWRGKCPRHPKFDPYTEGTGANSVGCAKCAALADIHSHHVQMLALMRLFTPPQQANRRPGKEVDVQIDLFRDL